MAKVKYSEFVEDLDAAAALDGTESIVVMQDGVPVESTTQDIADLGGGGAGYLVYTALLTQSGTDAPVATVLENTLGGAVVWSYDSTGVYIATLAGVFLAGKTFCLANANYIADDVFVGNMGRASDNTVQLIASDIAGDPVNDWNNMSIEIRVYP